MTSPKSIQATVVAASATHLHDVGIVTLELTYPRFIHAELMTHRVFSRNAASSRAIPVERVLESVQNDPAMPVRFGANHKGMQDTGHEHETPVILLDQHGHEVLMSPRDAWRDAAKSAAEYSMAFHAAGYHKQVCNRLTEPYQWMKTLVTSTEWSNFLELRDHEAADPTFQVLAKAIREALEEAPYRESGFHLPYIRDEEIAAGRHTLLTLALASANRCKRVSYDRLDGGGANSIERDAAEASEMSRAVPMHASPFEHQASHLPSPGWCSANFQGWWQFRQVIGRNLPYLKCLPSDHSAQMLSVMNEITSALGAKQ